MSGLARLAAYPPRPSRKGARACETSQSWSFYWSATSDGGSGHLRSHGNRLGVTRESGGAGAKTVEHSRGHPGLFGGSLLWSRVILRQVPVYRLHAVRPAMISACSNIPAAKVEPGDSSMSQTVGSPSSQRGSRRTRSRCGRSSGCSLPPACPRSPPDAVACSTRTSSSAGASSRRIQEFSRDHWRLRPRATQFCASRS